MRNKNWRQEPGGRRDDTCDHGLSRSWKVQVCEETKQNKKHYHGDVQGGFSCLLTYNTNFFFHSKHHHSLRVFTPNGLLGPAVVAFVFPSPPRILLAFVFTAHRVQHSHSSAFRVCRLSSNVCWLTLSRFPLVICLRNKSHCEYEYALLMGRIRTIILDLLIAGTLTPSQLETRFWGQNYLDLV